LDTARTLILTGASGKLGQQILEQLIRLNRVGPPDHVIAISRTPEKIPLPGSPHVNVRAGNFDEPESLDRAFAGGNRLLLVSTDAHDVPERRITQHRNAIEAAQRAGIEHVVYTSLTRPEPGSPMKIAPDHYRTEQALHASGLGWTVLRNNLYTDLLLEFLPPALRFGKLTAAAGEGCVSWVTREDCARTAAAALKSRDSGRAILDVTGPAAVGYAEIVRVAAEISGRPLTYVSLTPQEIQKNMAAAGMPAHVVDVLLSFQLATARGDLSVRTGIVEQLTGKAPTSVREFLSANSARLRIT
jgi:NAD(P)H dehydrogenase (quinone)